MRIDAASRQPHGPKSILRADVSCNKPFKAKFQALYDSVCSTASTRRQPLAWYDGVTKDNVTNFFKACGIGAIGGADDRLMHSLKDGNGIANGLDEPTKAREAAEAQKLAEILAGFEIEAPDVDDTGHVTPK
ncbi:hypothetical protein AAVH_23177 [Aphelenchoides avenae]|nr:hypothetical protein AAVH_23177 [Aphelenchus avenae]